MKITTKKELEFVIKADRMMNRGAFKTSLSNWIKNHIIRDYIMSYIVAMRKVSYYRNRAGIFNKIKFFYNYRKYTLLGIKLGFSIGYEVFGYGLILPHYGTIVVGSSNRIGNYAVIHTSTCITDIKRRIGDCLYMSTGAKITSASNIGNNITVGANSLVNKTIEGDNQLVGGLPAVIIKEASAWYIRDNFEYRVLQVEKLKKRLKIYDD